MFGIDDIYGAVSLFSTSESTLGKGYKKYKSKIEQVRNDILKMVKQEQEDSIRRFFGDTSVINALLQYKEDGTYDQYFIFERFEIVCDKCQHESSDYMHFLIHFQDRHKGSHSTGPNFSGPYTFVRNCPYDNAIRKVI